MGDYEQFCQQHNIPFDPRVFENELVKGGQEDLLCTCPTYACYCKWQNEREKR